MRAAIPNAALTFLLAACPANDDGSCPNGAVVFDVSRVLDGAPVCQGVGACAIPIPQLQ